MIDQLTHFLLFFMLMLKFAVESFLTFRCSLMYSLPIHVKRRALLALTQLLTNQTKITVSCTSNHRVPIVIINRISKQNQNAIRVFWSFVFLNAILKVESHCLCSNLLVTPPLISFSFFSPIFHFFSLSSCLPPSPSPAFCLHSYFQCLSLVFFSSIS